MKQFQGVSWEFYTIFAFYGSKCKIYFCSWMAIFFKLSWKAQRLCNCILISAIWFVWTEHVLSTVWIKNGNENIRNSKHSGLFFLGRLEKITTLKTNRFKVINIIKLFVLFSYLSSNRISSIDKDTFSNLTNLNLL